MKKLILLSCTVYISVFFFSCKKEVNGSNTGPGENIQGNWNFIGMDVQSNSSVEFDDGTDDIKSVTTSDYTTENNTGSMVISPSTMVSTNIAYSVNTIATSKQYTNGTLSGTASFPFDFDIPASSSTGTYRLVGTDSIYFESGSIFSGGVITGIQPSGAKLKLEGNILSLIQKVNQTTNSGGITQVIQADATIRLQRQ